MSNNDASKIKETVETHNYASLQNGIASTIKIYRQPSSYNKKRINFKQAQIQIKRLTAFLNDEPK